MPTFNSFQALANQVDSMDVDRVTTPNINDAPQAPKSASKPPPTHITGHTKAQVATLCTSKEITGYYVKLNSTGINVYCKSADDFSTLHSALKAESKQFFTHDIAADKEFKVVIKGLLDTDDAELKRELAAKQINPTNIRAIVPKKVRFDGQVIYVLTFPINTMKMTTLRQCKYLRMVSVEWDYYIP